MANCAIVGINWGDEGKGRMVDYLTGQYDVVVRYQGGGNAGHTVINDRGKFALHLLPSGIFRPGVMNILGNGVALDCENLVTEMETIRSAGVGISPENLLVSHRASLLLPWHRELDALEEARLKDKQYGSTKQGIAPFYSDKYQKKTIQAGELLYPAHLKAHLQDLLEWKNLILQKVYGAKGYTMEELIAWLETYAAQVQSYVADTGRWLRQAQAAGKSILFEGAQGTLLDIDHGTYPYVTSSSCCAGGAATGSGVGPTAIDRVLGIQKAYVTRVGGGPFPTELRFAENGGEGEEAEMGERLCAAGHEFGVTTGRKRRCGWFDAVIARYAAEVNGLTDVALTKLDVLSAFDTIKVCTAYECEGKVYDYFPMQQSVLFHAKPVYEELPGWKGVDITECRTFEELPEKAQRYVEYLEKITGVPVSIIAVGPDRDQTIMRGWDR